MRRRRAEEGRMITAAAALWKGRVGLCLDTGKKDGEGLPRDAEGRFARAKDMKILSHSKSQSLASCLTCFAVSQCKFARGFAKKPSDLNVFLNRNCRQTASLIV